MKYAIVIVATITLVGAIVFSSCDGPSHKGEKAEFSTNEASRDMESAKTEVDKELRIYRARNAERIREFNRTIEEIKQDINNEPDREVRARLESKLDEHEANRRELKHEMENYKSSGRENWDEFKDSFSSRLDDLGNSLKSFFSSSSNTSSTNQP